MRAAASLVGGEQAAHSRLHAENLEEVADDFDARGRFGFTAAGEPEIVGSAEGEVSGHILIDAALRTEFFVSRRRSRSRTSGRSSFGGGAIHTSWRESGKGKRSQQQTC